MKIIYTLTVLLTLLFTTISQAQDLHLTMMHDALEAVHDKYKRVKHRQNRALIQDPETDQNILDAKYRILRHAHTMVRNVNGKFTPINDNVTNLITPLQRKLLTAIEIRDAMLKAIKGREAQMETAGFLLNASGVQKARQWDNVNPTANDNSILISIANELDQFRTNFDQRAGTDTARPKVLGGPTGIDGAEYIASTLSLHKRIKTEFFTDYKVFKRVANDPNVSLVTRYTNAAGQARSFWNDNSLAEQLPEVLDSIASAYTAGYCTRGCYSACRWTR